MFYHLFKDFNNYIKPDVSDHLFPRHLLSVYVSNTLNLLKWFIPLLLSSIQIYGIQVASEISCHVLLF